MKLSLLYSTSAIMMACAVADTEEYHHNHWQKNNWHDHHPHNWKNKWNNHHPDHHNGSDRPCYNGYDKVCVHKECDAGAGYSDNPNDACGKAWYCNDGKSVWGYSEKDFDANEVHCGCNEICYKTLGGPYHGAKRWECCDYEEDTRILDKQEKMLRGAEEEKLVLKSE